MNKINISPRKAFKGTRENAKEQGALTYIDGKECKNTHIPTVRLTHSGWCSICYDDYVKRRRQASRIKKQEMLAYKPKIYCRLKLIDGTMRIEGPYKDRFEAVQTYKRLYLQEYGINCPSHYFDETP